jgi:predicted nucleotidyltransferase
MASPEEVEEALFDLTALLDREAIPYAVMGVLAVRVYSIPRATQDVDITIEVSRDKLEDLRDVLYEHGCSIPPVYDSGWLDQVAGMSLFKVKRHIGDHSIDLDIFIAESSFQRELLRRRSPIDISGRRIALVSPEDLLLLKIIAGRPRDKIDVQDMLFTLGELDNDYLNKWAKSLGVIEELEQAMKDRSA